MSSRPRDAAAALPAESEPSEALHSFVAAVGAGDLLASARCFTRDSCVITADGTAIHGREEVSKILSQLIACRTRIEVGQVTVRRAGHVALAHATWTMRRDGPGGHDFAQSSESTAVLRDLEGCWRLAILAPWGGI